MNLLWDNEKYPIAKQYTASANETIPIELNLKVDKPKWDDFALVQIDENIQRISIPTIEKDQSLVFDSATGIQTKKWEFEHEYYVLLPSKFFDIKILSSVFKDWIPLDNPAGDWQEYVLLWVRTINPFLEHASSKLEGDLVVAIERLERIVDELKLPSFGHQYRVLASLIGGELIESPPSRVPVYNRNRSPYLEISGIWRDSLEIILRKKHEFSGQFIEIDRLLIDSNLSGNNQIIELWGGDGETGIYEISIVDLSLDFQLIENIDQEIKPEDIDTLEITANIEDTAGITQRFPSRHALSELQISVKAWPYAELSLEVKSFDALKSNLFTFQVDEAGLWSRRFSDLPIAFDSFPPGNLLFKISWRGLFNVTLAAIEKGAVSTKEFNLHLESKDNGFLLFVSGYLLGILPHEQFSVSLFSEIPWEKDIYEHSIRVHEYGYFKEEISLNWMPKWLVFWHVRDELIPIKITEVDSTSQESNPEIDLQYTLSRIGKEWVSMARRLIDYPHPPLLDKYLLPIPFLGFLDELATSLRSLYYWKYFSRWEDWNAIKYYLNHGFSLFLFKSLPPIGVNAQYVIKAGNIQVKLSSEKHNGYELRIGESEKVPIAGILKKHPIQSRKNIRFQTLDRFCYCAACKVLIPLRYFSSHLAPYEEADMCNQQSNMHTFFEVGENIDSVVVGVLSNPLLTYNKITEQLRGVLSGQRVFTDDFSEWLPTLRRLMPEDADPKTWLEELLGNLQLVMKVIPSRTILWNELEHISQEIRDYEEAIRHIIERIHQTTLSR